MPRIVRSDRSYRVSFSGNVASIFYFSNKHRPSNSNCEANCKRDSRFSRALSARNERAKKKGTNEEISCVEGNVCLTLVSLEFAKKSRIAISSIDIRVFRVRKIWTVSKRRKIRVDQAETRGRLRGRGGGLTLKISKAERRKREM